MLRSEPGNGFWNTRNLPNPPVCPGVANLERKFVVVGPLPPPKMPFAALPGPAPNVVLAAS